MSFLLFNYFESKFISETCYSIFPMVSWKYFNFKTKYLRCFQYYYDAAEAESWMSEQELNMMGDERGKDEASASAMLKKHETLEAAIADYSETVNELGDTAKALVESEHPER